MKYLSFKYKEGDWGLQEVIDHQKHEIKTGFFEIKIVRTPNVSVPVSHSPLVCKGEDYRHCIYAMAYGRWGSRMCFYRNPNFPDSEEGFEQAVKHYNSLLLEFQKMKGQASPKRWPMFKN